MNNEAVVRKNRVFNILPEGSGESGCPLDIAIISPDIVGPRHGGIGTAYSALAEILAQAGHRVTLLFFPSIDFSESEAAPWIESYRGKGISFVLLKISKEIASGQKHLLRHALRSLTVYEWLKESPTRFDVLHFPEWSGIGYYSLLAHREGIFLPDSQFVVGVHSSTRWHQSYNDDRIFRRQQDLETVFMEEESIRLADVVVSPSRFYLEWLEKSGIKLPEKSYYLQNVLSPTKSIGETRKTSRIEEIVFFGRLERRKGIILFCDAIDQAGISKRSDVSITFLGPLNHVNGIPSDIYLANRAKNWQNSWKIISNFGKSEALNYLMRHECLAVMPSYAETMSYTVLECLGLEIPFLASNAGGIPELIASRDLDRVCFPLESSALAMRLEDALNHGMSPAEPAMTQEEVKKRWISWHGQESINGKISDPPHPPPTVSVCLSLESCSGHPLEIMESLKKQTHPPIDCVVSIPDNLSSCSKLEYLKILDFFSKNGWKIVHVPLSSKARYWEKLADAAGGDVLIFLDERTIPFPRMIERFLDVSKKTGADLLTSSLIVDREDVTGTARKDFLGPAIAPGFFKNVFGEGVFFITRNTFTGMKGLLGDIASEPLEWGFLANAILSGYRLETIPEALAKRIQRKPDDLSNHNDAAFFPGNHPYFPSIDSQVKDLFLYLNSVRGLLEQAPNGSFIVSPQRIVDDYLESRAFKLAAKFLGPVRKLLKKPVGSHPSAHTLVESVETLHRIQASPEGILASVLSFAKSVSKSK